MDSTNNIPTTPNCGFESLIEDEEAACLVRRITLTSYDDLYRLVKASISPDDLPNSELERFGRAFARYFGVFLFDVRMQNPTSDGGSRNIAMSAAARSFCCRLLQRRAPSPLWRKQRSYFFSALSLQTT